ncbi:MAG TPA: type II secretion system protein [Pyrinomonadaceae bacterium]|nr:type II secretion system protein [Pyrinomonadaceae bacterium]
MFRNRRIRGFSLIELVITLAVLAILTLGVIPLVQVSVKRQKEQQLREALRTMREAIDQFHREANAVPNPNNPVPQSADPRTRVFISDQTIFTVDNPDRYPPDLDTLVKGVDVLPFVTGILPGGRGNPNVNATAVGSAQLVPKTKIYLRAIPIDPMTGKADWGFRSCYDEPGATSSGGENVFDVYSKSDGVPLDKKGKYSDW